MYPAEPRVIGQSINTCKESFKSIRGQAPFSTWEEMDIPGQFIETQVLNSIEQSSILFADISVLNFNVTFEIGFAIGKQKRVILFRNEGISPPDDNIRTIGIFDTLGFTSYENSEKIFSSIDNINNIDPIPLDFKIDPAPIYLLQTPPENDDIRRIVSAVKRSRIRYRAFDPSEEVRLGAPSAIKNVSASHGVIIPLLGDIYRDKTIHNIRAAFVAGLAHGMDKLILMLQPGADPVPLDYRDFVSTYRNLQEIDRHIADFAPAVVERLQDLQPRKESHAGKLASLNLGSSTAENEMQNLENYFLPTDAFHRIKRGEARIIVGRKGSGKTAVFAQVRDQIRSDKQHVVLDLKPEGFQLRKLKDVVLTFLAAGAREHLVVAFWEYLLCLEIIHKILEKDREVHKRNHRLFEPYQRLRAVYDIEYGLTSGDFSERMLNLVDRIGHRYEERFGKEPNVQLRQDSLTEILYSHDISSLLREATSYMMFKGDIWILLDNLDKAWTTHGLSAEDIVIIRGLLDATRKLERHFTRQGQTLISMIFIRQDVYELLLDETPDRGKDLRISLDWTNIDLLRELIRRRLNFNESSESKTFEVLWNQLCVSHFEGEDSADYLIRRSFMRPRYLINLINHCRSFAVNLNHDRILVDDIREGLDAYSTDCLIEIGMELRDVLPEAEDILYCFIGEKPYLTRSEIERLIDEGGFSSVDIDRMIYNFLWYGILGIVRDGGEPSFIYNVNYDIRRLEMITRKLNKGDITFIINPALWNGLEIAHGGIVAEH